MNIAEEVKKSVVNNAKVDPKKVNNNVRLELLGIDGLVLTDILYDLSNEFKRETNISIDLYKELSNINNIKTVGDLIKQIEDLDVFRAPEKAEIRFWQKRLDDTDKYIRYLKAALSQAKEDRYKIAMHIDLYSLVNAVAEEAKQMWRVKDKINAETSFSFDLGKDELDVADLINALNKKYHVRLAWKETSYSTIGELAVELKRKVVAREQRIQEMWDRCEGMVLITAPGRKRQRKK